MHPNLLKSEGFHYKWKYIPIEEDFNACINQYMYKGKVSGAFYHKNDRHPIVVVLSDKIPENTLYIVSSDWEKTTSPFIWELEGLNRSEWHQKYIGYKSYTHPLL